MSSPGNASEAGLEIVNAKQQNLEMEAISLPSQSPATHAGHQHVPSVFGV